jgi:hypothetical protein
MIALSTVFTSRLDDSIKLVRPRVFGVVGSGVSYRLDFVKWDGQDLGHWRSDKRMYKNGADADQL